VTERQDFCTSCGQRPTCRIAEAAVLVVARDYRGVVTSLCSACGGGDDDLSGDGGGDGREVATTHEPAPQRKAAQKQKR